MANQVLFVQYNHNTPVQIATHYDSQRVKREWPLLNVADVILAYRPGSLLADTPIEFLTLCLPDGVTRSTSGLSDNCFLAGDENDTILDLGCELSDLMSVGANSKHSLIMKSGHQLGAAAALTDIASIVAVALDPIRKDLAALKSGANRVSSTIFSSLPDLAHGYELRCQKMIQSRLYASLGIMNFSIKESKPLEDSAIFRLVAPYLDGEGLQRDGKIHVHLGVVSPESWSIRDPAVNFECVGGTLEECINSLKSQERPGVSLSLSTRQTRQELPAEFDFYAIFEVATERNHYSHKIKELEHQLQYILARHYLRGSKDFPPLSITDIGDSIERKKAYTEFVSLEILKLVAFCGLASPVQLDSNYAAELVGTNYPCVSAMMKANRMLCFKVAGINERLERIEKLLEDLAVETIKLRK